MAWVNEQVAGTFREISELLELSGDQSFRVRAYDRASRALSGYGADLASLSDKQLAAIPGLGKSMAAKVREYLETSRVATLEKLRAEVPEGLRVLVKVPGIGPRKARLINERLGVATVEDLSAFMAHGRLPALTAMA
jgi:DNA polymerase (family 10)